MFSPAQWGAELPHDRFVVRAKNPQLCTHPSCCLVDRCGQCLRVWKPQRFHPKVSPSFEASPFTIHVDYCRGRDDHH
jgi:hypothetical protein